MTIVLFNFVNVIESCIYHERSLECLYGMQEKKIWAVYASKLYYERIIKSITSYQWLRGLPSQLAVVQKW